MTLTAGWVADVKDQAARAVAEEIAGKVETAELVTLDVADESAWQARERAKTTTKR